MADPSRLRSDSGSLEALLLRSSPSCEPPPLAEEEVWRRVQAMTAAGAALGATALGAQGASAASKIAARAVWSSLLKWTAVIAVGAPSVGLTAHWALHRDAGSAPVAAKTAVASPPLAIDRVSPAEASSADAPPAGAPADVDPGAPGPAAASPQHPRVVPGGRASAREAPSALKRESLSLAAARAKYASGNPRDALDDVGRLGLEFPRGTLSQEREVLAMDCLEAVGDGDGARARARAFLDRFPASPYLAHVRPIAER